MSSDKFYITTPIYYVNAKPHIGHTYTTVAADVLARFHKLTGARVFFATGTDEHGAKIAQKAKSENKDPLEFTDEISGQFKKAWSDINIKYDRFIRTTEKDHIKAVRNALQFMKDKGDIYKDKYEGLYCVGCEQFKNEKDLVDGKCPDHQTVPEFMSEETYVFKMSRYADRLLKMIEFDEFKIGPEERKNEILSFYKKEGLKDVSFSRKNIKWGIPLPWDEAHTAYVWSDAFLNYLTVLDWDGNPENRPQMWPPELQLMSKDILRVHATIWPAMLLSLELPLPREIFVHGFFLVDGQKMSKSIGNVIAPEDLIARYGVDATRYLLMSTTAFGGDGDISWKKFDEKYTADLANGIGNLVARSITLVEKMRNANMELTLTDGEKEVWGELGFYHKNISEAWDKYFFLFKELRIDEILFLVISGVATFADEYITATKPWELIKNNDKKVLVVMYNILERIRHISIMLYPFMPATAEEIMRRLGLDPEIEFKKDFKDLIKWGGLSPETKVDKGEPLFPRLNQD
ncbi:methionine--tRNA ligase [Candidatus Falkowbacteria bacterium RIFOXYB2_FULL_47_14]|uniref:methionine--tRNA ligase n=1 Tax=Candidatus Falkowbacteria bacterium RIFOXYA2_FULL_47_19 TaxID=1797994 RepID=A0A1F5SNC3_9BACT|nr:MAG: methionine--tRNA ligase [Candidatus Falkowbacteria bacterium RIFOXYA2_FULL_47_19]OGF36631.1 MAG: methionine--tRNA ligase [Candidatus Falkowbacteria bacterium RIFOXYC2_FULL_46_15]OGF42986.1 MAG: methionine--tRNA ligase [Candidatus Falkowbacteria bacterium RIFOXYB2_FULL_47_14]